MVLVKSRVDGPIVKVLFAEGDTVRQGDPLLEIDPRPYQAAVAQAEGELARDQAQLSGVKADLDRTANLLERGFASHQAYDRQAALFGQYSATVKTDQALLDNAQLNLSFTRITAPMSGRIGKRLIDAGNLIRASEGTALAEIVQIHPISVLFTVPQGILGEVKARQKEAALVVEAASTEDRRLLSRGSLSLIGNRIDPQTGTIELKASFENVDEMLWPGQLVEARLITRIRHDAVSVPLSAIAPSPKGRFVYVVGLDRKVTLRPVTLGPPADGLAVVESGLATGERVVLEKQDLLAPGMEVQPEAAAREDGPATSPPADQGKPS